MHPLLTAHLRMRQLDEIEPRPWSPYWPQWARFVDELQLHTAELELGWAV